MLISILLVQRRSGLNLLNDVRPGAAIDSVDDATLITTGIN